MIIRVVIMIFIVVAIGFAGCNNTGESGDSGVTSIIIARVDGNVTHEFDSLFRFDRYIVLDTNEESVLGKVNKIYVSDSIMYIMNDNSRITIFDSNGGFIRTISHVGHGPGEYVRLNDFDVKDSVIYCLNDRLIHKYGPDGKYIGTINLENAAQGLCVTNAGFVLNNGFGFSSGDTKENYSYSFVDSDGKTENCLRYNKALTGLTYTVNSQVCKFAKNGTFILTSFPYNDTIYSVNPDNGEIKPFIKLKIGDRNITQQTGKSEIDRILNSNDPSTFGPIYNLGDKILLYYIDEFPKIVLVGMDGNVLMNGIATIDKNGLPIAILDKSSSSPSEEVYSIVPASLLLRLASKKGNSGDYPILKKISNNISEESNPVLVIYK